jgi:hypothetical protein
LHEVFKNLHRVERSVGLTFLEILVSLPHSVGTMPASKPEVAIA